MDQLRPFKASFYGVNLGLSPWAVLCILSQSLLFQQHPAIQNTQSLSLLRRLQPPEG